MQLAKLSLANVQWMLTEMENAGRGQLPRRLAHIVLYRACKQAAPLGHDSTQPGRRRGCAHRRPSMSRYAHLDDREKCPSVPGGRQGQTGWKLFYVVAAPDTGMRLGELLGLQWSAIDLKAEQPYLMVKTGSCRTFAASWRRWSNRRQPRAVWRIALSQVAIEALWEHRKRALAAEAKRMAMFFAARRANRSAAHTFMPIASSRCSNRPRLPTMRFHDLRHTMGSAWLAGNVHPKVVQERLGHSTISVTMDTYSHVLPTMHQEAADRMGKLLASTP